MTQMLIPIMTVFQSNKFFVRQQIHGICLPLAKTTSHAISVASALLPYAGDTCKGFQCIRKILGPWVI